MRLTRAQKLKAKEVTEMAKKSTNKEFNFKLYAIVVFFAVATALVAITYSTYVSRYIALSPEKVATNFVDTVAQTGDGYNAYKNTVASKNMKYGDFIRKYYMNPLIFRDGDYSPNSPTDALKGYNDDSFKGEKTLNDDGTLAGQVIDTMYPVYEKLVSENGWDNYDKIYTEYFNEFIKVRKEVFGDDYLSDEVMFTALEANVLTYGQKLTGTEDTFDENTGAQLTKKQEGVYEKLYGEDYKLTTFVSTRHDNANKDLLKEYLANLDEETFKTYGIEKDDISDIKICTVYVSPEGINADVTIAEIDVTVVKIKSSWYVDNTVTDTSALYEFYEIG